MASSLFLSYSRREAPFVDSLAGRLEQQGCQVWLDYHSLVPARPWKEQIDQGIEKADVFALVVSKESMTSKPVREEWERARDLKKRIVLVLFEATELPPELAGYEWVDFRVAFKKSVDKLLAQLETPTKQEQPPPQSGFKAPLIVWAFFLFSLLVGICSIATVWTIYLPYHLLPLPYRIFKRDFNFFHVQSTLIMLPFLLFETIVILGDSDQQYIADFIEPFFLLSVVLVLALLFLLRSPGMQRWGKPIASRPKFANPHIPNIEQPTPIHFTVDFTPEDRKYADDLIKVMKKHGHAYVADRQDTEAAFVLISTYKNTTSFDPETKAVFPIILQDTKAIDPKIKRIQWIDFRRGLKNLDIIAQLAAEPVKLLKALGINPPGNQTVLPPIIQTLEFFLTLMTLIAVGSYSLFFFQHSAELIKNFQGGELVRFVIILVTFSGINFLAIRSLISRRGKMASSYILIAVILIIGFIVNITLFNAGLAVEDALGLTVDEVSNADLIPSDIYLLGLIILVPLTFWYRHDFRRWFPAKGKSKKSSVQKA